MVEFGPIFDEISSLPQSSNSFYTNNDGKILDANRFELL